VSMALPLIHEPRFIPLNISEKVALQGRFFFLNDEKFFLKGVTYGPFSPSHKGVPFPEAARVETDFTLMAELGANCLRTFTPPPDWLLDMAASCGLRVIVGIPWAQHISFLNSSRIQSEVRKIIVLSVEECRRHPATFAYLIGNEIPPEIVLVGSNFPSTEYLETDFTGFLAFNVYLHRDENFRCYLFHLQQECLT
jgi:O-antigen biosynthesis protein